MHVLFAARLPLGGTEQPLHRKLFGQLEALRRLGCEVDTLGTDGRSWFFCPAHGERRRLCGAAEGRLRGFACYARALRRAAVFPLRWDLVYLRTEPLLPAFLRALGRLHRRAGKLVLEIPTYPFFAERRMMGPAFAALALVERLQSRRLRRFVDLIASFCDETTIFGVPAVGIENGVDPGATPLLGPLPPKDGADILGLAVYSDCHGYDRIVEGMAAYYGAGGLKDVTLHLAGPETPALRRLTALAARRGLTERVIEHGELHGRALDELFSQCDVGAAALGMFRKGLSDGSNLKVREYCARGLPFLYAYRERSLSGTEPFALRIPNTPEPVDIGALLAFVQTARQTPGLPRRERAFAAAHYCWGLQFQRIFSRLGLPEPAGETP